ncbi:MAG: endonuclease/exonuclease/phosphatase family protein [Pseudomonadota bacterium]
MRDVIISSVEAMETPPDAARSEAVVEGGSARAHARFQAEWPCLNTVEVRQPSGPQMPDEITVAAWNIERCKRVEDSAEALNRAGADIVLATEVDWGMARSSQRHTPRDLAAALGMGYAFGVEFVELGTGDAFETEDFAGMPNDHGLHGNAILSRFPMTDVALLPLDDGGYWYVQSPKGDGQHRVGGRMAMAARVGGVVFVAAHYESESDAEGRADQTRRLTRSLQDIYGDGPTVIGGDFNTRAFADLAIGAAATMENPATTEPSFAVFAEAGFDWQEANAPGTTTRVPPRRVAQYPLKKLDWVLTRGVTASDPRIWPAVSLSGVYLSDHELLTVRISR